nr:hypothetical protein Iba_chr04dCG12810 [Ipomoea batatas]
MAHEEAVQVEEVVVVPEVSSRPEKPLHTSECKMVDLQFAKQKVILKDGDTVAKYCGHLVCDGERFVRSPVLCDRQCCNHNDKGSVNRRHLHSKEIAATMRSQYGKERNQNSLTER